MSFIKINNDRQSAQDQSTRIEKPDNTNNIKSSKTNSITYTNIDTVVVNWADEELDVRDSLKTLKIIDTIDEVQEENSNIQAENIDTQSVWISSSPINILTHHGKIGQAGITTHKTKARLLYFRIIKRTINTAKLASIACLLIIFIAYLDSNKPHILDQPKNSIIKLIKRIHDIITYESYIHM